MHAKYLNMQREVSGEICLASKTDFMYTYLATNELGCKLRGPHSLSIQAATAEGRDKTQEQNLV